MLNLFRTLFTPTPTEAELAFRDHVAKYVQRRELAVDATAWSRPDWLGAVAADVFLQAGAERHLRCTTDVRTMVFRLAFACYGLARRAGVALNAAMIKKAAFSLGETPSPKALMSVVWDALDYIEERRICGSLEEQSEEVMTPRYVTREEPLVLQSLSSLLEKQMWQGRQALVTLQRNAPSTE